MTADEIGRSRDELAELRRRSANVKRGEVEKLAVSMGWAFRPKKGGHPRYDKPGHRMLNRFTLEGILDQLETDLDREEEWTRGN